MSQSSQFRLLTQRRFAPFFATQLAGAWVDSMLKQLVVLLVTFHAAEYTSLAPGLVTNLVAGLFILPFVLFSAYAGQLADKFDKARVIRGIKLAEVAIMGVAAAGFMLKSLPLLLLAVFAMGTHSAFFGPVKYSILPRVLDKSELTGGNGLLEMGTFLSILGGTIAAGVVAATTTNPLWLSVVLLSISVLGLVSSYLIPPTGAAEPNLALRFSVFKETAATLRMAKKEGVGVWNSLLAISWFWFVGALVLSQLPALGQGPLRGDATVVTTLLAVFSVGVAIGSLLCERLSGHKVEIGLVPVGSIGLSLFTADLAWATSHFTPEAVAKAFDQTLSWSQFLATSGSARILADIALVGVFGGLFIVPLYAFVQSRTASERQSRIISANNVLNSLFMVVSSAMAAGLLAAGLNATHLLAITAGLNVLVAAYIYKTVPEFLWRFAAWVVTPLFAKVQVKGALPEKGAVLMSVSRDSLSAAPARVRARDLLALSAISPRPLRFCVPAALLERGVLGWLLRRARALTLPRQPGDAADNALATALKEEEALCFLGAPSQVSAQTLPAGVSRLEAKLLQTSRRGVVVELIPS